MNSLTDVLPALQREFAAAAETQEALCRTREAGIKALGDIAELLTARIDIAARHLEQVRSMPPSPVRDREEARAEGILLVYQGLGPVVLARIETYLKESA